VVSSFSGLYTAVYRHGMMGFLRVLSVSPVDNPASYILKLKAPAKGWSAFGGEG